MPHVDLDGLAFAHADEAPILSGVDLRLAPGWTAVVGEDGAGKTTLLRLVAGGLPPAAGRVRVDPPERKRWQIGAALAAEPDVLLLDEPTNHADAEARALLLVTHDDAFARAVAPATWRIAAGGVHVE